MMKGNSPSWRHCEGKNSQSHTFYARKKPISHMEQTEQDPDFVFLACQFKTAATEQLISVLEQEVLLLIEIVWRWVMVMAVVVILITALKISEKQKPAQRLVTVGVRITGRLRTPMIPTMFGLRFLESSLPDHLFGTLWDLLEFMEE